MMQWIQTTPLEPPWHASGRRHMAGRDFSRRRHATRLHELGGIPGMVLPDRSRVTKPSTHRRGAGGRWRRCGPRGKGRERLDPERHPLDWARRAFAAQPAIRGTTTDPTPHPSSAGSEQTATPPRMPNSLTAATRSANAAPTMPSSATGSSPPEDDSWYPPTTRSAPSAATPTPPARTWDNTGPDARAIHYH